MHSPKGDQLSQRAHSSVYPPPVNRGMLRITSLASARAGAVRVALVAAPAVLGAPVPAGALRHLLGGLAGLGVSVEHVALAASKLVGLL